MTSEHLLRVRAAGVVIQDGKLLVMFRRKGGREYYTFPGGGIEPGELPAAAAAREIEEETTLRATCDRLLYELVRPAGGMRELFFLCTSSGGAPALAPESVEQRIQDEATNFFAPQWLALDAVPEVDLLPPEIAAQLMHDIDAGFPDGVQTLEGAPISRLP